MPRATTQARVKPEPLNVMRVRAALNQLSSDDITKLDAKLRIIQLVLQANLNAIKDDRMGDEIVLLLRGILASHGIEA